jgi:gluconate 2-dehydrogenase gamma chain
VGTAAAGASAAAVRATETGATVPAPPHGPPAGHPLPLVATRPAHDHTDEGAGLQFFGRNQAITIDALAARIIPTDALGPGAREAGVIHYIDRALAGAYAADQPLYLRGLAALDAYARDRFGDEFAALTADQQDQIAADLEANRAPGFADPSARAFFDLVWRHTMEGFFGDPMYGGNQDFVGWKLVGFPGVVGFYTPEELLADYALDKPIRGMADWTRPF